MKTETLAETPIHHSTLSDLLTLSKVRLNTLVVATAAGGYYMGAPGDVDPMAMLATCVGTALVAGGASAINQVQERDTDRLMERTRLRPLADGRMTPAEGTYISFAMATAGELILWFGTTGLAALVSLTTYAIYALVYTPLKRRSSLNTIVGAVPGALPPLIGWAASRGTLAGPAPWTLFLIMFLWQLPHFLSISWLYRADYARAGLKMLSVVDTSGGMTGRQATLWAATLIVFSLLPAAVGLTYPYYGVGAFVLGTAQLVVATRFALKRSEANARALFYTSITYLPLLWTLMAFARR
jgi:protoheme IX farnesyltransferase